MRHLLRGRIALNPTAASGVGIRGASCVWCDGSGWGKAVTGAEAVRGGYQAVRFHASGFVGMRSNTEQGGEPWLSWSLYGTQLRLPLLGSLAECCAMEAGWQCGGL